MATIKTDEHLVSRTMPLVSVIVPVRDDNGSLHLLLESLANQTYPLDQIEVIVVHNSSQPLKVDGVGNLKVVLSAEPNGGSYAARNKGVEQASGQILCFTDSDCIAHPCWISNGVERLVENDNLVLAGEIQVFTHSRNPSLAEVHQKVFAFNQALNIDLRRGLPTANLFVTARTFSHVGWFNPLMVSGGDVDWSRRALELGAEWALEPAALIYHPARLSFQEIRAQRVRHAMAMLSIPGLGRRLDWFAKWISPRQLMLDRLRTLPPNERRYMFGLVRSQLGLAFFQLLVGTAATFGLLRPPTAKRDIDATSLSSGRGHSLEPLETGPGR